MTAIERKQSPHSDGERLEADPRAPDSESSPRADLHATVTALSGLLGHGNTSVPEATTVLQPGKTAPSSLPTLAPKPPPCRQLLLEFAPESSESSVPQDTQPSHSQGERDAQQDDGPQDVSAAPEETQPIPPLPTAAGAANLSGVRQPSRVASPNRRPTPRFAPMLPGP